MDDRRFARVELGPVVMIAIARLLAVMMIAVAAAGCQRPVVSLGFWFEDVTFESPMLGGRLTADDLRVIEAVARGELASAFRGLDVALNGRRESRFRVRVTQTVVEGRMRRHAVVAGESRSVSWAGGFGSVNFTYYASGALVFAPPGTSRSDLVAAIGRGLGRGAVHEFAHQLLTGINLHATRDRGSYEYYAASREQQYYGPMHWDHAGPLLQQKYAFPQLTARR